eukprot:SAG31_NODE_348_length_17296_cov_5.089482_3_plen_90_part_00
MRERLQQLKNMIVDRDERLQEFKLESETVDRDVEKQTRELEIAEKELHVIKVSDLSGQSALGKMCRVGFERSPSYYQQLKQIFRRMRWS